MSNANLKPMVESIISAICTHTKTPRIDYHADATMEITGIHPDDEGRLIGKKGVVFWAITAIHFYACRAQGLPQVRLLPLETSPNRNSGGFVAFRPRDPWDKKPVTDMIDAITANCLGKHGAWMMDETGGVTAKIQIKAILRPALQDPNFEEALDALVHSAGKAAGASIRTEVTWV